MKITIKDMVVIAIMTILICVCTIINIPYFSIPFTLQTFAIFLTLLTIGGKKGIVSIILYIVLGLIGLPVFSNGTTIFGPTGGYIVGFIFIGISYIIFEYISSKIWIKLLSLIIGLFICYVFGVIWFYIVMGSDYSFWKIMMLCVVPYIIPDLVKLALAYIIGTKLKRIIN